MSDLEWTLVAVSIAIVVGVVLFLAMVPLLSVVALFATILAAMP